MVKIIVLCGIWFLFGIFTGWKIFSHMFSLISFDISDEYTDEEAEEIIKKIMEKFDNEQKRKN